MDLDGRIRQARVLMVGAGGIGCELLKDLVIAGFGSIDIVDLDTIDLSNLNRQFLFRREHIKRSKAEVAKVSASAFNQDVTLTAHQADIKASRFDIAWFGSFDIVFNALDNLDARRHVNLMCVAAAVPLVDTGTAGYQGQVQVVIPGQTECYDCTPKPTPKSFPVCTIRSTPSKPVHCVVWAKSFLFAELFGLSDSVSIADERSSENGEDELELDELRRETAELRQLRDTVGHVGFDRTVFDKVFRIDIERLGAVKDVWPDDKVKPVPLQFDEMVAAAGDEPVESVARRDRATWSTADSFAVFRHSLDRLSSRFKAAADKSDQRPVFEFDKDDDDALDFVSACSNLRSAVFSITSLSKFAVKQVAGNIIPAIATTNATVAGLAVLDALKLLSGQADRPSALFLNRAGVGTRLFASQRPCEPAPGCSVCAATVYCPLAIRPSEATIGDLAELIVGTLGFGRPDESSEAVMFSIANNRGAIIYESDDPPVATVLLADLGVKVGDFVTVVDDADDEPLMNVVLAVCEVEETDGGCDRTAAVSLTKQIEVPRQKARAAGPQPDEPATPDETDQAELVEIASPPRPNRLKRSHPGTSDLDRADPDDDPADWKRLKPDGLAGPSSLESGDVSEPIMLVDDQDEAKSVGFVEVRDASVETGLVGSGEGVICLD